MEEAGLQQEAKEREEGSRPVWLRFEGSSRGACEERKEPAPETQWTERLRALTRPAAALRLHAERKGEWRGAGPRRWRARRGPVPKRQKPWRRARPSSAALRCEVKAAGTRQRPVAAGAFAVAAIPLIPARLSNGLLPHRRVKTAAPSITAKWSFRDLGLGVWAGARRGQHSQRAISCSNRHCCRHPSRAGENTIQRPTPSQHPRLELERFYGALVRSWC